jgi:hypothetical protein
MACSLSLCPLVRATDSYRHNDPAERAPLDQVAKGTVNLSRRVSRMQATGSGHWGLLLAHATDFGPDSEFLGPGSSMLCGSDVIAAEVEEVIDLIVC